MLTDTVPQRCYTPSQRACARWHVDYAARWDQPRPMTAGQADRLEALLQELLDLQRAERDG
jgi:hypothetical protein